MAEFVLLNYGAIVNGTDLTDHVRSIEGSYSNEVQDKTAMLDGARDRLPGLFDSSLNITFNADEASGSVNETLHGLTGTTSFTVVCRRESTQDRADGNPDYTFTVLLQDLNPVSGSVGDVATVTANFVGAGTALTRTTSST